MRLSGISRTKELEDLEVYADNGGGLTLQTPKFAYHYSSPEQCAEDLASLLTHGDTIGWENSDPFFWMEYDPKVERNGEYTMYSLSDLLTLLQQGETDNVKIDEHAMREMIDHLQIKWVNK